MGMKKEIFVGLAMIILLTACGSKSTTLNLEMKEFVFLPDTFTVPAGEPVTLNIKNTGTLEHEYVIMILGREATIPFGEEDEPGIFWEQELEPAGSITVQFTAPAEAGEYQVVCGTAGHLEQGMKGKLIVVAK